MPQNEPADYIDNECISCGEAPKPNDPDYKPDDPDYKCPKSKRSCGHHCNHSWSHEECCWCGATFGDVEESLEVERGGAVGH